MDHESDRENHENRVAAEPDTAPERRWYDDESTLLRAKTAAEEAPAHDDGDAVVAAAATEVGADAAGEAAFEDTTADGVEVAFEDTTSAGVEAAFEDTTAAGVETAFEDTSDAGVEVAFEDTSDAGVEVAFEDGADGYGKAAATAYDNAGEPAVAADPHDPATYRFDPYTGRRVNVAPPPTPPQRQKGGFRSFLKGSFVAVMAVAVIFSAATSAFLLKEHLDRAPAVATPVTVAATNDSTVAVKKTSGSDLSVSEINTKVAPSVVLITGKGLTGGGQGSGVIISDDGYIVTNAHVVSGFSELTVTLNNDEKTTYSATIVGSDSLTDLAVIKVDATGLPAAELGTSASLQVGQDVVVIGNPLGEEFTGSVTTGIISALDRQVQMSESEVYTYIQTDAAINTGNSGGPLVDMEGRVIGINAAKISTSVAEGMGFAIPVDDVIPVTNDLIAYGYVKSRPYIGISGESLSEQVAAMYQLPLGVHVTTVAPNGPAAAAGLQVDDIITAINGKDVTSIGQLNLIKNKLAPGDSVELEIYRYAETKTLTVTLKLAEMPQDVQ